LTSELHAATRQTESHLIEMRPEMGPNVRIRATSVAPVASVFASRAMATLPLDNRSPIDPKTDHGGYQQTDANRFRDYTP